MNKSDRKIEVTRENARDSKSRPGKPLYTKKNASKRTARYWAHQGCAGSSRRSSACQSLVASRMHDHLPAELGGCREVVLATDVAETAVLVPGITHVVGPACGQKSRFR
jgi:hypothetical protein